MWNSPEYGEFLPPHHYSNYNGADPDGNGISNTPYQIPGGASIDHFPLMQLWTGGTQQLGDLNSDGCITPADTAIALGLAASDVYDPAADMSDDGKVTSIDALMILQAAAGAIEL